MTTASGGRRTDTASRVIRASPRTIYRAFVDPDAWVSWIPPGGMTGRIEAFDARVGGGYRMTLTYEDRSIAGKSTQHSDVVEGRFVELIPDERVVQAVEFQSDDPGFAGTMTMTWALRTVQGGTEVTITCENVPEGISQQDHDEGLKSTLGNLAAFTE